MLNAVGIRESQPGCSLPELIESIRDRGIFGHPVERLEIIETHISYVLLTGRYAYKFKKPLKLHFLDFSTLELRKYYCEEELRLNCRLAPEIYLDVVPITGDLHHPVVGGSGRVLEYAVRMVQFARAAELGELASHGVLTEHHMDLIGIRIAAFHHSLRADTHECEEGSPAAIREQAIENFRDIRPLISPDALYKQLLNSLEAWTVAALERCEAIFRQRNSRGFIRECHGDVHLGNIAFFHDRMVVFDCIEFSRRLRVIDTMSEVAFLVMDLEARGLHGLANRFLNTYLQSGGDYSGLSILRFYLVYRALVRCKVDCIRLNQPGLEIPERRREISHYRSYLDLAYHFTRQAAPVCIITHGLSGSGKTSFSRRLAGEVGAICIRSDIERKRLCGLAPQDHSRSATAAGIYTEELSQRTYLRMAELARIAITAGYPVIIDAAFLMRSQRRQFHHVAQDGRAPFIILDFQAGFATLRQRIEQRMRSSRDASEADPAILEYQIRTREPLFRTENVYVITVGEVPDLPAIVDQIHHCATGRQAPI